MWVVVKLNCLLSSNSLFPIDEQLFPSNHITLVEIVGIVTGALGTVIIVLLFYCFAKKRGWLSVYSSSSRTTNRDPVSPYCQLGLHENMLFPQVLKKPPEIGKTPKLFHTIMRKN